MKTAIEFVDQFATYDTYEAVRDSKKFALRAIDEIITALESHEWQNKNIILEYKKLQNEIINLEL